MRARSVENTILSCLVLAMLSIGFLSAATSASRQNPQQANQQRPRTVGTQSNANAQQQTNSSGEEVGEGDVVRVETRLVSVPTVVPLSLKYW